MNKRNKVILVYILLVIFILFSTTFALINSFSDKFIGGIYIQGINASNYNETELKQKLEEEISKINNKKIILTADKDQTIIELKELDVKYEYEESITEAYKLGRKDNIIVSNYEIIKNKIFPQNISINIKIDEKKIDEKISSLNSILENTVEESGYYIDGKNLIITRGKSGIAIDKDKLKSEVIDEINKFDSSNCKIEIPTYDKDPEKIDIETIYNKIRKEPTDAYVSEDGKVHPNVDGIDFAISLEEASNILKEEKEEYTIPLKITKANITLNDLGKDAFPDSLGTFTTRYDETNENRSNNIKLSSEKIDGTIVMPGETFSYNQIVGKRTIDAGYAEAGAYAGGKVIQEVGGGICQVSSTLYNAVLYANLEIIERSNHYFETSYVSPGRDATVSWGSVDFKFKNNKTYPIVVEMISQNGVCKANIKGISEDEYEVVIQTKLQSIVSKDIKYENDYTVDSGIEKIKQYGHDGCTVDTYKIIRKNGQEISSELISSDYYHALERIILRGAKQGIIENKEENNFMEGLKPELIENVN